MAVTLAVTYRARAGSEDEVAEYLRKMMELTRAEPGCLHYSAHRSTEDRREFLLFEQYVDQAALDAHSASDYFRHYVLDGAIPLLEERVRRTYTPVE